ncbi:MAG: hypothetical protein O2807_02375 [bacterium]|nr:hypothetical protein [bacterium]
MTPPLSGTIAICAGWAAFGLAHSLLARSAAKERACTLFGELFYNGYYRISYNLLSLAAVGWLWLQPGNLAGDIVFFQIPALLAPAVFLVKGAALLIGFDALRRIGIGEFSGWCQLASAWRREATPGRPSETPVQEGVYLWVRHPLNTATFMWVWAQPDYTLFHILFAACVTGYILIGNHFEERDLIKQFGRIYQNYQLIVPPFWGPFWGLKQRKIALESRSM